MAFPTALFAKADSIVAPFTTGFQGRGMVLALGAAALSETKSDTERITALRRGWLTGRPAMSVTINGASLIGQRPAASRPGPVGGAGSVAAPCEMGGRVDSSIVLRASFAADSGSVGAVPSAAVFGM